MNTEIEHSTEPEVETSEIEIKPGEILDTKERFSSRILRSLGEKALAFSGGMSDRRTFREFASEKLEQPADLARDLRDIAADRVQTVIENASIRTDQWIDDRIQSTTTRIDNASKRVDHWVNDRIESVTDARDNVIGKGKEIRTNTLERINQGRDRIRHAGQRTVELALSGVAAGISAEQMIKTRSTEAALNSREAAQNKRRDIREKAELARKRRAARLDPKARTHRASKPQK